MFSLKNVRFSQKLNLLILLVVIGFAIITVSTFALLSLGQKMSQARSNIETSNQLLSKTRFDLLELNKLLVTQFTENVENAPEKQFKVRSAISESLISLKSRNQNSLVDSDLKAIDRQLKSFDSTYQDLILQKEVLGENAKKGLLLDLALVAEQFETVLVEINSATVKLAVLDLRRDEKKLVENPNSDSLVQMDEKIYALINILSKIRQPKEKSDFILSVVASYSESLSQLVTLSEGISLLQAELIGIAEQLSISTSGVQAKLQDFGSTQIKDLDGQFQFLSNMSYVAIAGVLVFILTAITLVKKSSSGAFTRLLNVFTQLNKGRLDSRSPISSGDEVGQLSKALNQFLDFRVQILEKKLETFGQQNKEIDALVASLEEMLTQGVILSLAVPDGRLGEIAKVINKSNHLCFEKFKAIKDTSMKAELGASQLQSQSATIAQIANDEMKQVVGTTKALKILTKSMSDIAVKAQAANNAVGQINAQIQVSKDASIALSEGLSPIREQILLAEKRMESLLELSQSIQEIVNVVNGVADRAHILALNTSMCNEPSDELTVVDDMQDLAQHARTASREVLSVVESTRNDLFDTINVMNRLVEEVVAGISLAEYTNERVGIMGLNINKLDQEVSAFASSSAKQAVIMGKVGERANVIQIYLEKTNNELKNQVCSIDRLKRHTQSIETSINELKLPNYWEERVLQPLAEEGVEPSKELPQSVLSGNPLKELNRTAARLKKGGANEQACSEPSIEDEKNEEQVV